MNRSPDHARLLLEKAAEDRYVLESLAADAKAPDEAVGFHAQQAVEKLLKAVLTGQTVPYGRTHDLDHLLALLGEHGISAPPDADELATLTPFAVDLRHDRLPSEDEEGQGLDRAWAVACVRRTEAWAQAVIRGKHAK